MAMNSEIKQQILYDSFDMFKDDWDNNVETLKSTIAKIAMIDLSVVDCQHFIVQILFGHIC